MCTIPSQRHVPVKRRAATDRKRQVHEGKGQRKEQQRCSDEHKKKKEIPLDITRPRPPCRAPSPAELPPSPLVMASQSSKTADTAAPPPEVADTGEAAPGAASSTPAQNPNAAATAVAGATDLEKKMRRAERFGMPVLMSEEEKRSSRAER